MRRRRSRLRTARSQHIRRLISESLEPRLMLTVANEGMVAVVSESLDGAGLAGALSAQIDWGDGHVTSGTITGSPGSNNVTAVIDYTYDTNNFFNTPAKKDALQWAADQVVSHFSDDLAAVTPGGVDTWTIDFFHPGTGAVQTVVDPTIGAGELRIYAGGRSLGDDLGQGGQGGYTASGTQAFIDAVQHRGQGDTIGPTADDIGPWGGSITFDSTDTWHWGPGTTGLDPGEFDFHSVAIHELSHLMGFGGADSWINLVSGSTFTGAASVAAYDGAGNVPLSTGLDHWAPGTLDEGLDTVMDASIPPGEHIPFTPLDVAALDDIGWQAVSTFVTVDGNHTYGDNGNYTVTITVTDADGDTAVTTAPADVFNVNPTLSVVGSQLVEMGTSLNLTDLGTFSDPGFTDLVSSETFSYTINWGDGTPLDTGSATIDIVGSPGVDTTGSFDGTHVFAAEGTYNVLVDVIDDDGGLDQQSFSVVVHDDHADSTIDVIPVTPVVYEGLVAGSIETSGDGDWFSFAALNGSTYGLDLTLGTIPDMRITFVDQDGTTDLNSYTTWGGEDMTVNFDAPSDGTYYARLEGSSPGDTGTYTLGRPAIVADEWGSGTIYGSDGDDVIDIDLSGLDAVTINGNTTVFPTDIAFMEVYSNGGYDTLTVTANSGDDGLYLSPQSFSMFGSPYELQGDAESITVNGAGGSGDVATLVGTAGEDDFYSTADHVALTGAGFFMQAENFGQINVQPGAGYDEAFVDDSAGDDTYVGDATDGWMNYPSSQHHFVDFERVEVYATLGGNDTATLTGGSGDDFYDSDADLHVTALTGPDYDHYLFGFDQVVATAGAGGYDEALMFDSLGDDLFEAHPDQSDFISPNLHSVAIGFDLVSAYAGAGGSDSADFYDSAGDDVFVGSATEARLTGTGFANEAYDFGDVDAFASGGNDVADLYDGSGDDRFYSRPTYAYLRGPGFDNYVKNFEVVNAHATAGGYDKSYLYDGSGDDVLTGGGYTNQMTGTGFQNTSNGFEWVGAYAAFGGYNVGNLFDTDGDDRLYNRPLYSWIRDDVHFVFTKFLDRVNAYGTGSGYDIAYFYDSDGDDTFTAGELAAEMIGPGFHKYAEGFEWVAAYSVFGGSDTASLYDTTGNDTFRSRSNMGLMIGSGLKRYAWHFEEVYAYSTVGNDQAEMEDSSGDDLLTVRSTYVSIGSATQIVRADDFADVEAEAIYGGTDSTDIQAYDYLFTQLGDWS